MTTYHGRDNINKNTDVTNNTDDNDDTDDTNNINNTGDTNYTDDSETDDNDNDVGGDTDEGQGRKIKKAKVERKVGLIFSLSKKFLLHESIKNIFVHSLKN